MALQKNISVKDPDTINPADQSVVPGADTGIVVTHHRPRYIGITVKRNGKDDGCVVSMESYTDDNRKKPVLFTTVNISLTDAHMATILGIIEAKVNNKAPFDGATPIANPSS